MDLHPIFVHFPVALFTLYAVLELLPLEGRWGEGYFYVKFAFLLIGAVTSVAAYISGSIVGEMIESGPLHDVVELHAFFAGTTIILACVALILFLLRIVLEKRTTALSVFTLRLLPLASLERVSWFTSRSCAVFFAVLLLGAVTVTGGLGGSIVYGPDADPFVRFLYHAFGLPS